MDSKKTKSHTPMPTSGIVLLAYRRISPTELKGDTKEEKDVAADHQLKLQTDEVEKYVQISYPPDTKIIWYEDKLLTGTKIDQRMGFESLMTDLDVRKPYGVIFTKIARFARSVRDLLNTAQILKDKGIALLVVKEKVDTSTAQGYFFFVILGAIAELEVDMIKERTNAGKAVRQAEMEAAGRNWGRPRYVVKNKLTGEKFQLSEETIANIKKLRSMGMSIEKIAGEYHISTKPVWNIVKDNYKMFKAQQS